MSKINDWSQAFVQLKRRAEELRGIVELTGAPNVIRWPRTIGADVIAIAALIDPHVRRDSSEAIRRRWHMCLADIDRHAIAAPGEIYVENQAFWRCLVGACVYLASVGAALPDETLWNTLTLELGDVLALRNAGPKGETPFAQFDGVKTFADLYMAQYDYVRTHRGVEKTPPEPGQIGDRMIPRTTNADVVVLADYWSKQLARVKKVSGHAEAARRWATAIVDVNQLARSGDPAALYPKNNHFWRQLSYVAVQVSAADEAPSKWDMAIDSLKDSVKNLPENIVAGVKTVASGVGEAAGDLAQGVGRVANSAGKGLFAGFGTPLLIGGGLLGMFLISRGKRGPAER